MAPDLSSFVLRSPDVDAARRFYEAIGLSWQEEQHAGGPRHHSSRVGETLFELYPTRDGGGGRVRLAFHVANVSRAADAAIAAGGRRVPGKSHDAPVVVEDPDGNQVELLPPRAAAMSPRVAGLDYEPVLDFLRSCSSRAEDSPPFDVNGVIHLLLAALDNLKEHWIEADLDQLALAVTPEQRLHLIAIGAHLGSHESNDAAGLD
jgi:catechol 2,3-dioxygenase-like lactoylglutathione lyase family enzyme